MQVCHAHLRGNAVTEKGMRSISIHREYIWQPFISIKKTLEKDQKCVNLKKQGLTPDIKIDVEFRPASAVDT